MTALIADRSVALTLDVLCSAMRHAHPVLRTALGLVNTRVTVKCHAPHRVTAYLATSAALMISPVGTNARDCVERSVQKTIAKNVQGEGRLGWTYLR